MAVIDLYTRKPYKIPAPKPPFFCVACGGMEFIAKIRMSSDGVITACSTVVQCTNCEAEHVMDRGENHG